MTTSAAVGAVGVYSIITDETEKYAKEGTIKKPIVAGKYKLIGQPFHKLTDEEEAILTADVIESAKDFKACINSKRNIKEEYLEGLDFNGKSALANGFVDIVVDSLDEFLTNPNITTDTNNKSMTKFTKIAKSALAAVTSMVTPKAESPKEDVKPEEKAEAPKEEPKTDDKPKSAKLETNYTVSCPHCSQKFGVEHDEPQEEVKAEDVKPDETKPEEKAEAPKEDVKPEEKAEEPKEDKKQAFSNLSMGELMNGNKPKTSAFHQAVNQVFFANLKQ
jgi:hypothetical protein